PGREGGLHAAVQDVGALGRPIREPRHAGALLRGPTAREGEGSKSSYPSKWPIRLRQTRRQMKTRIHALDAVEEPAPRAREAPHELPADQRLERVAGGDQGGGQDRPRSRDVDEERADEDAGGDAGSEHEDGGEGDAGGRPDGGDAGVAGGEPQTE